MFLIWLLWLTLVIGGGFLGGGYALEAYRSGPSFSGVACAVVFLGSALFSLPKLLKLVIKK